MNIIYLNEARMRRQLEKAQSLVSRIAQALLDGYAIQPELPLAETLGYEMSIWVLPRFHGHF